MPNINDPASPEIINPEPLGALAGNHADDDGLAIDDILIPADQGPQEWEGYAYDRDTLEKPTRIIANQAKVGYDSALGLRIEPVMLFPADIERRHLMLTFGVDGATSSQETLLPPVQLAASTADTGGTIPANTTYRWVLTAVNENGETIASNEVSILTSGTATNTITLNWELVDGADFIRIYVTDANGPAGTEEFLTQVAGTDTSYLRTAAPGNQAGRFPPEENTAFISSTVGDTNPQGAIQFASEKADCFNAPLVSLTTQDGGAGQIMIDLHGHTGALWVYSSLEDSTVTAKAWAVTT